MTPRTILVSPFGQVGVFDECGRQVPELQVSLLRLWAQHAQSLGHNPDGWEVEFAGHRKARIVLDGTGRWNCDLL